MSLVVFQDTKLNLIEDLNYEFLLSNKDIAIGYGCSIQTIRSHLKNHNEELKEGKHWIKKDVQTKGGVQSITHWTKKGIVRLGFFIKSERAKKFRDWAEDYIVNQKSSVETNIQIELSELRQEIKDLKKQLVLKEEDENPFKGFYTPNWAYRKRENEYAYSRKDWMLLLNECEKTLVTERQNKKYKQLLISGASK
ncbi:Bro-N domain-containing protein [Aliarcobacter butzleri]|uniref:Bro-N domain-containing protein n=1 Tax=Aliarcobacter butzleri TaxID=28197 RepID=UPI001EDC7F0E|nr:Bro-N domain-containing protein [Aliarcobacter butzleri]MCG3671949.1 Bro-N domain-containing protein [Aliarcobacter butzleri]